MQLSLVLYFIEFISSLGNKLKALKFFDVKGLKMDKSVQLLGIIFFSLLILKEFKFSSSFEDESIVKD